MLGESDHLGSSQTRRNSDRTTRGPDWKNPGTGKRSHDLWRVNRGTQRPQAAIWDTVLQPKEVSEWPLYGTGLRLEPCGLPPCYPFGHRMGRGVTGADLLPF